jgi:hypothetical protein
MQTVGGFLQELAEIPRATEAPGPELRLPGLFRGSGRGAADGEVLQGAQAVLKKEAMRPCSKW